MKNLWTIPTGYGATTLFTALSLLCDESRESSVKNQWSINFQWV